MEASGYFTVNIPMFVRDKLLRLAQGSRRSMGNVVEILITKANEDAPEWNIIPRDAAQPAPYARQQGT